MLPKEKRLNLKKDFGWVSSGKKLETSSFKLRYKFSNNIKPLIGIAITSSIFKKATLRNKVKRITSKTIENLYSSLRNSINLVIMPKMGIFKKDIQSLEEELKSVKDLYNSN